MIRAKLYLNAAVYTGTPQYGLCAAECEKIIARHNTGTNHGLAETYKYLFGGDNDRYARGGNLVYSKRQQQRVNRLLYLQVEKHYQT